MNILVVGGGGREHAIIWSLKQNNKINNIYCAPGNAGIGEIAECIFIEASDISAMTDFALKKNIDLVVVGPDAPLAIGMVDVMESHGIRVFGPQKSAAFIESSKVFSKNLMHKYNIPTAQYETFSDTNLALQYLEKATYPIVIKADGLALGKGVIIAQSYSEAKNAVIAILQEKQFGESGNQIVIEEFLQGVEISILAFTDGTTIYPMVSAKDHKRAYDNDQGLNTGGMGCISPSPAYTDQIAQVCMRTIYIPTIEAMNKEGRKFKGVLFFGLIITKNGPYLLEYNSRFGDPETQVVLPRLKTDLIQIINAIIDERLSEITIEWDSRSSVCVVAASGGYPLQYETGFEILGLDEMTSSDKVSDKNILVFHAGTKKINDKFYTSGGRVLGVTALEDDINVASKIAYNALSKIKFDNMHYRSDIGKNSGG